MKIRLNTWVVLSVYSTSLLLWGCGGDDSRGPGGIGPQGGTVTSSDGKASVIISPGALSQITPITVAAVSGLPSESIGTAYEFGPNGTTFSQPVTILISYDETELPSGTNEADLKLGTLINNIWQVATNSTVDTGANVVSGTTMSFSIYGIIVPPASAPIGVAAVPGDGSVTITWNAVPNATSYNLYMASQSGVTKSNYADLPDGMKHEGVTSPFVHTGLTNGKTYYFVVTAMNFSGETPESNEVKTHPFIVDQIYVATSCCSGFQNIQFYSPIGQEFTPSIPSLDVVELLTQDFGNAHNGIGAELVVNIRVGTITGPIVGTSIPVTLPDFFSGITHFDFSSSVPLIPGSLYVIEVTVVSGDFWGIGSTCSPCTYLGGSQILLGLPQLNSDLWFREGQGHTVP